jgi:adenylate kinase family enzyme
VRIAVVGSTGSGKTTLARELAARFGLRHIEIDALLWEPNWTAASDEVLRARAKEALGEDGWVSDGNYSKLFDLTLARAQMLVWLDYAFPVLARQLLRRTVSRSLYREELWNGNRETFAKAFFTRDSILLWLLRSYRSNRRRYLAIVAEKPYPKLEIIHLRSPAAMRAWLAALAPHPLSPSPSVDGEGET